MPEEHDDDTDSKPVTGDEGKTFTQADVDRIVKNRLRRLEEQLEGIDALKAKANKLDELEAANKSDLDKATEKLTAAEQRAAAAELHLARLEVAVAKGVHAPLSAAKRLVGTTKEELEADLDSSIEDGTFRLAGDGPKPPPGQKPKPDLKPGGREGNDADTEPSVDELVKAIPSNS